VSRDFTIFAGTANPALDIVIARELKVPHCARRRGGSCSTAEAIQRIVVDGSLGELELRELPRQMRAVHENRTIS
jgi:hypothetical protein